MSPVMSFPIETVFMMRHRLMKYAVLFTAAVLLASCGRTARIEGSVAGLAKGDSVVVKLLDINVYKVLDTIPTDASGHFRYSIEVGKGQPEFVYLFRNDVKLASLLLERGDRVSVTSDTLGNYTVSGSPESEKLSQVEKDFAVFTSRFAALADSLDAAASSAEDAARLRREMVREYTDYYRSRVKYILENSHSLTVVPVLYQSVSAGLPVFGQETDAIHFRNICDSLETVYPESRYVKSLRNEAKRRSDLLSLKIRIENAPQLSYPDLELPDVMSEKVKLSEVDAKVVLLHFWTSSDAAQKMFNLDVLKPVYKDYHSKGLEIYQVALDADKAVWARTVKDQGLEWINVCDGLGLASPAVATYNLSRLPVTFVISSGELVDSKITDEASLRRLLDRLL